MRELVRDDEAQPVVVMLQRGIGGGRRQQHDDAFGREHGGETVRRVDVIGQGEVDGAARHVQLPPQQAIGPLGFARGVPRHGAEGRPEVHAEVERVHGAPGP